MARYVVRRGWLHLILLTGVGIFAFPFVWMVATSIKTDEEVVDPHWMPAIPRFVAKSPYVLPAPELNKPMDVDAADWERLLPELRSATDAAVRAAILKQNVAVEVDPTALRESASAVLLNKLAPRLNGKLWAGASQPALDAYRALLTPDAIDGAIADRTARLEIRGLVLRTLDARTFNLCDPREAGRGWAVESGPGRLVQDASRTTYLAYDFGNSSASAAPIVLRYDFTAPADAEQLHKVIFSVACDDSWHQLDANLQIGGRRWVTDRTSYLALHRQLGMIFQPPSFEDQTLRARLWVPMNPTADVIVPASGARKSSLWITIRPSSTLAAIWGKVTYNYQRAFQQVPFWRYVGNSVILVALCTLGTLFSSTFVAYAFARLRWPGRGAALLLLLSTMMLPSQVTMIPGFLIWRTLGWYNTFNPMWVPAWLGSALFIFLMIQYMKTIPRELEEAARIDGLNAVQTWYYIILPLVKPAAAAIAIMTVLGAWNEFMAPLIYLRDQSRFPLSLGLFGIRADQVSQGQSDWTMIMAGNVLMILPVVAMFVVFQKSFVQGVTMSGIKG
jgi:multiple sugar transport system permease protein